MMGAGRICCAWTRTEALNNCLPGRRSAVLLSRECGNCGIPREWTKGPVILPLKMIGLISSLGLAYTVVDLIAARSAAHSWNDFWLRKADTLRDERDPPFAFYGKFSTNWSLGARRTRLRAQNSRWERQQDLRMTHQGEPEKTETNPTGGQIFADGVGPEIICEPSAPEDTRLLCWRRKILDERLQNSGGGRTAVALPHFVFLLLP
jgi:hypothetical protein